MISGTSKIWSKSGPVDLLIITKMLQKIQENYGIILENIMFVNLGLTKFRFVRKMYVLGTIFVRCRFVVFVEIRIHVFKITLWR